MSANYIRTISPSTQEVLFERQGTTFDEVVHIAKTSHNAFQSYKKFSLAERKSIINKALDLIDEQKETLAAELTAQMGRPIAFAAKEITTMRKRANYLVSIADKSLEPILGTPEDGFRRFVKKEPLGVAFIAFAWNVGLHYLPLLLIKLY